MSMNMQASTGWNWLKQGGVLFRKQPAALTTLLFANILFSIAISAVPLLGPMVAVVLIPSFSMAFMMACLLIEDGQRVTLPVLLTGFRKPVVFELAKVGLAYLVVSMLLALVTRFAVDPGFWEQVSQPVDPKVGPQVSGGDVMSILLIFALDVVALISLCFAAPLTYWQKMSPGKAIFYSFFAVMKNARVFFILLLSWFAIFFAITMVVTTLFGASSVTRVAIMWLIFLFILVLQCAIYVGYRQIFGKPQSVDAKVSLAK